MDWVVKLFLASHVYRSPSHGAAPVSGGGDAGVGHVGLRLLDAGGVEYSGRNVAGLFAQPGNLLRPRFWAMPRDTGGVALARRTSPIAWLGLPPE
jgi:hypothetical protein